MNGGRQHQHLLLQGHSQCAEHYRAYGSSLGVSFATHLCVLRYLLNGNILAARAFVTHFVSLAVSKNPTLRSNLASSPLTLPSSTSGDEVVLTTDSALNFLQLAVRTCQRANGSANKKAQEAWIRLVGAYANKGGVLAQPEVRRVSRHVKLIYLEADRTWSHTIVFE